MKASTIAWHLARDNCAKLARFCEKHKTESHAGIVYRVGNHGYFDITFKFDNGGYITAELLAGDEFNGYTVADHFQVKDYALGT